MGPYTLKLTKKQVLCLINHCDSPYIRGLGFMYLRFTLPPTMMYDWFEPYLDDTEEIDVKAGGGKPMTMGEMIKTMLTRLEWYETRFPRIAVNSEKVIRELPWLDRIRRQNQWLATVNRMTDRTRNRNLERTEADLDPGLDQDRRKAVTGTESGRSLGPDPGSVIRRATSVTDLVRGRGPVTRRGTDTRSDGRTDTGTGTETTPTSSGSSRRTPADTRNIAEDHAVSHDDHTRPSGSINILCLYNFVL